LAAVGLALLSVGQAPAVGVARQSAPPSATAFDVASVRPREQAAFQRALISSFPGGRFEASNASVRDLVVYAFGLGRNDRVEGGSPWVYTDRFDIAARLPEELATSTPPPIDIVQEALQHLLVERFNLSTHREQRSQSGYALVLA
jgi:uncharacterized protein (TIGR03435 family)